MPHTASATSALSISWLWAHRSIAICVCLGNTVPLIHDQLGQTHCQGRVRSDLVGERHGRRQQVRRRGETIDQSPAAASSAPIERAVKSRSFCGRRGLRGPAGSCRLRRLPVR